MTDFLTRTSQLCALAADCVLACCFAIMTFLVPQGYAQGQGTTEEISAVFERYVRLGEDLSHILARVKDKQSAEAVAPELRAVLVRVGESRREINGISSLSPELVEEVTGKYERRMREAWGRVFDCMYRLQRVRCYGCVPFFSSFSLLCSLLDS